ncbi:hypothetical protein QMZ05_02490 [Bradyrhizobium sp. INPA03-11B]|uniref:hypothetical protein n=1 Tax=Bradyrhizobium sp. INPA03-11B TaxID=418598 RepID=UPI00338E624E
MKKLLIWTLAGLVASAAGFIFYEHSPPNAFNPLCTYDFAYRETVTLEVGGRQYTSSAVNQLTRSAQWVEEVNKGGCPRLSGTMLSFRLADNRLILIEMGMCQKAFKMFETRHGSGDVNYSVAMQEHRKVDIAARCFGIHRSIPNDFDGRSVRFDAFLIDSADKPTSWRGLFFRNNVATLNLDEHIRIVSAIAEADDAVPEDQLNKVAPAILKTSFVSTISDTPILPERTESPQFVASKDPLSDTDRLRLQNEAKGEGPTRDNLR